MVAGSVDLQDGYSDSGWDSTPCHASTISSQLPYNRPLLEVPDVEVCVASEDILIVCVMYKP